MNSHDIWIRREIRNMRVKKISSQHLKHSYCFPENDNPFNFVFLVYLFFFYLFIFFYFIYLFIFFFFYFFFFIFIFFFKIGFDISRQLTRR